MAQRPAAVHAVANAVHHELGFVEVGEGLKALNQLAVVAGGPQLFAQPSLVAGDQAVGGAQNGGG